MTVPGLVLALLVSVLLLGLVADLVADRRVREILSDVDVDGYHCDPRIEVIEQHPELYVIRFRRIRWETIPPPAQIVRGRDQLKSALRIGITR